MKVYELSDKKLRESLIKKLRQLRDELHPDSNYLYEKYPRWEWGTDVHALKCWIHALTSLITVDAREQTLEVEQIMRYANELYTALKEAKQI